MSQNKTLKHLDPTGGTHRNAIQQIDDSWPGNQEMSIGGRQELTPESYCRKLGGHKRMQKGLERTIHNTES